jgi:hypothetical protein
MTGAASPAIWRDPTPLRVLGTGAALPGEPIMTEELLTAVDRRFALSLRRPGLAIAHKLGSARATCAGTWPGAWKPLGKDIAIPSSLPLPCGPR